MSDWVTVCKTSELPSNSGRCVKLGNAQIALFKVSQGTEDIIYAIDNFDPFSGANVLSRGIVGSMKDTVVVASPMYKQHFCLRSGACMEDNVNIRVWKTRTVGENLQLAC